MQFSDGTKIRAQIDTDSMKAMLAVAGGGSVALLAFLPYLLGKPDMQQFARAVVWGLISFQVSLLLCLLHNVLRRRCSAVYERAWSEDKQPKPGNILGWQLETHPGVCFWSWTFLWLAVVAFAVGSITICVGGLSTLHGEGAITAVNAITGNAMAWNLTATGLIFDIIGFVLIFALGGFQFGTSGLLLENDKSHITKWPRIGGAILVVAGFALQLAGAI